MLRDVSGAREPDAINNILQELMHLIMQLQTSRRTTSELPMRDEPVHQSRNRSSTEGRRMKIVRQYRTSESNTAGLREQLHASLNSVAAHVSSQGLQRELTGLDGLIPSSWSSTSKLANGSQPMFDTCAGRNNTLDKSDC